jgi:hypothetical protein
MTKPYLPRGLLVGILADVFVVTAAWYRFHDHEVRANGFVLLSWVTSAIFIYIIWNDPNY